MLVINSVSTEDSLYLWWEKPLEKVDVYSLYINERLLATTKKTHYTISSLHPESKYFVSIKYDDKIVSLTLETKKSKKRIDITSAPYFVKGDGKTVNTLAIQRALNDLDENTLLYFPKGEYLTGALRIKSNSHLYLEDGAIIQGSAKKEDYLPLIPSRFEGLERLCYSSLINIGEMDHNKGYETENVSIMGKGTISSGGKELAWDIIESEKIKLKDYLNENKNLVEECEKLETIPGRIRPRLINISNAKNVHISGLTLKNGASWMVHILYSDSVITDHCTFYSEGVWNGDGWDPDSSTNCILYCCSFHTEDDSVAIKSGKNPEGNIINRPSKHIRVFDCKSYSGHGIIIGSEISGGIEDIMFWDNDLTFSSNGYEIKSTWKRGGYVKDVLILDSIAPKILLHSVPYNNDGEPSKVKPIIKNIKIKNLLLDNPNNQEAIIEVIGFDKGNKMENISLSNITISSLTKPIIKLENANVEVDLHS